MPNVDVHAEHTYPVIIGQNLLEQIPEHIPQETQKILLIHPPTLTRSAEEIKDYLDERYQVVLAQVPDAEESKQAEVAAFCWQVLGQSEFGRTDTIVSLGGGATTDLAGFIAATWLRGIAVVHLPTTLLAMVDASVGGKTGINTAEGKNLVGAFYSPQAVLCDVNTLKSLPKWDLLAGMAEVIKTGFIADEKILSLAETAAPEIVATAGTDGIPLETLTQLIHASVQVKGDVVGKDLKEAKLREILNYGHTFAHAIEQVERYRWRHGAAVSVGMVFAAEVSRLAGRADEAFVQRHRDILGAYQLPLTYPDGRWSGLLNAMRKDKKARSVGLRFVLLEGVAKPYWLAGPDPSLLISAYEEVSRAMPKTRSIDLG